jgi:hypothetical protein
MQLRKIDIAPDNELTHEIFCVQLPSANHLEALVMKFSGICGHGAEGNGDANYMEAVSKAAISFTDPDGLIFDFTELNYQWGDLMGRVLFCGEDRRANIDMPMAMAIVVSDRCEKAIRSLLKSEFMLEDLGLVHHSLDSAVSFIDEKNKPGASSSSG